MFVGKDIARLLPCYCCSITGENGPFSQGLRISIIDKSITDIGKDEKRRPAEVKGVTRAIADGRWSEGCTTRVYMHLRGSHGSYFSLFNRRQVKRDEQKKKK